MLLDMFYEYGYTLYVSRCFEPRDCGWGASKLENDNEPESWRVPLKTVARAFQQREAEHKLRS